MKVLHIVRALDVGGLERVVLDLVDRTISAGIDSQVVCLYHAGIWGENRDDIKVLAGRSKPVKALQLARMARRMGADILHSHNPEAHIVAAMAGVLSRIPVLHTKHGRNFPDQPRRVWLNMLLDRMSKVVVAVSADAADVARDLEKCPRGKLTVIHNGIDTEKIMPMTESAGALNRTKCDVPPDAFVLGTVGRLSPDKDYKLLIAAFFRLVNDTHDQNMRLVMVGDGPEREDLEREAAKYGMQHLCVFAGEQRNVPDWLSVFDVFCLSSRTEGLSISLLEAGAAGLPCVVTDVGGNREVVCDQHNGFLVPYGDVGRLADALRELYADPARRQSMGRKAREVVEADFSLQKTVAGYVSLYQQIGGIGGQPLRAPSCAVNQAGVSQA